MNFKSKFYFLPLTLFLFHSVSAQGKLGSGAETIINDLLKKGIYTIGDMDLRNLKSKLRDLKWEYTTQPPVEEIAWGRRSAYYLKNEKQIWITQQLEQTVDSETLGPLELHEALGALGYRDHNYAQTSSMIILNRVTDEIQRKHLVESFGKRVFDKANLKVAGGGSSVGGGGDLSALLLKLAVLDEILKSNSLLDLGFYPLFVEINFEPTPAPFIEVEYHLAKDSSLIRGAPTGKEFFELLTVAFPENKISPSIISKIGKIIVGLVPTHAKVNKHIIRIDGCANQNGVIYPETHDSTLITLQMMRASFLLNCESESNSSVQVLFRDDL